MLNVTHSAEDIKKRQSKTPFLTACKNYIDSNPTPFDVPSHKMGRITTELSSIAGEDIFRCDFNAAIGLDNLFHPTGVIKEAQDLAAEAYHAKKAIFLVNGSTGGLQIAINALIAAKEKIILPRNVHKSVINSIIFSGAYPIFVKPEIDKFNGIANGVSVDDYVKSMDENPDTKVLFVINPTYFGVASDLVSIVKEAHARGILVMVDEAHGSHFTFSDKMPISAMDAGADIAIMSTHKTAGSLTQSSLLLINNTDDIDMGRIMKVYSMFTTTSPSHILLASLDAARKLMFFEGERLVDESIYLAEYARKQINKIPGLSSFGNEYFNSSSRFAGDSTKLVINCSAWGITGFQLFRIIRERFNIQLELGEINVVLAVVGIGSRIEDIDVLLMALKTLSKEYFKDGTEQSCIHFILPQPELVVRPRDAFYAPTKEVPIAESAGEICAESVMIYPPGIPLLIPGEVVGKEEIDLIDYYVSNGGFLLSDSNDGNIRVIDQSIWYKADQLEDEYD